MQKHLSRRDFLSLAALTTSGVVLAACTPPAAQPEAGQSAGSAPATEVATVRLGVWASPDEVKFFENWVKPYQDDGHSVNIEYVDWTTYWTKLPTQFSAGTAPDVMEMSNFTLQFGPQGVLADLHPFMDVDTAIKMEDFVAVPFEKFDYEGQLISFPMGLTIQFLGYNKKIFDDAGVPYPDDTWDWTDMLNTAIQLTKDKDGNGPNDANFDVTNVVQWGIEMALDEESGWSPLVFQNEAEYWKNDYTEPNFTDPAVVEAFQFLADMINKYQVAPSPAAQQKFNGSAFQAGQAAMSRQGTYMLLPYLNNITSFEWDVVVPPKGKTYGVMADGIGWSMSSASSIKDDAWDLIKFFNTDGQEYMGSVKFQVPILKSAFGSFAAPPPDNVGSLNAEFEYGHRWPTYTNQQQVDDFIGQKTTQIFDGQADAATALAEIQDFVAPLVKG
ncbi:MAG: extracellular solute-binding protein [Caldilineaceae bacterium]